MSLEQFIKMRKYYKLYKYSHYIIFEQSNCFMISNKKTFERVDNFNTLFKKHSDAASIKVGYWPSNSKVKKKCTTTIEGLQCTISIYSFLLVEFFFHPE